jgi:hypothetical protein
VPPEALTEMLPLAAPLQLTSDLEDKLKLKAVGSVMDTDKDLVHPLLSLTVTEKVPAPKEEKMLEL